MPRTSGPVPKIAFASRWLQTPCKLQKIVSLFEAELRYVIDNDGAIPMTLYATFKVVACIWKCDTQEIEGYNNMIQQQVDKAPNIDLELLDARCATRKDFNLGSRDTRCTRYCRIKPIVDDMLEESVGHCGNCSAVLSKVHRWALPPPAKPLQAPLRDAYANEVTLDRGS